MASMAPPLARVTYNSIKTKEGKEDGKRKENEREIDTKASFVIDSLFLPISGNKKYIWVGKQL